MNSTGNFRWTCKLKNPGKPPQEENFWKSLLFTRVFIHHPQQLTWENKETYRNVFHLINLVEMLHNCDLQNEMEKLNSPHYIITVNQKENVPRHVPQICCCSCKSCWNLWKGITSCRYISKTSTSYSVMFGYLFIMGRRNMGVFSGNSKRRCLLATSTAASEGLRFSYGSCLHRI